MKNLYNSIFAAVYDPFMARVERQKLTHWRKELLSNLKGNVLEIGSGTGANFPYYPEEVQLTASDPSEAMLRRAKLKVPLGREITFVQGGIGDVTLDNAIKDRSLDAIISTLVLCTVPDPNIALERFQRWLKPGGKVVLIEHIHASTPFNRKLQNFINPVWNKIADGCNLNRHTDPLFRSSGFHCLYEHYDTLLINWYLAIYQKPD